MDRLVFRLEALLGFGALLAFLIVAGAGFLVAALYLVLADAIGATLAALISGAACLGTAGIVALIAWLVQRPSAQRSAPSSQTPDAAKMALAMGEMLGGDLNSLAKNHRKGLIGAALVAGLAVGASPKLRRSLLDLLDN